MLDVLRFISSCFVLIPWASWYWVFYRYGRINIAVLFGTWMYCRGSTGHIAGIAVLSLRRMPH